MAKNQETEIKTNEDYYKSYRKQYIFLRVMTYVSLIMPMVILISVNFNKYFNFTTEKGVLKFSLSCVILIFCTLLAIVQVVKKIEDKKYTLLIQAIYWFCAGALTVTLSELVSDIGTICICISAGLVCCSAFNFAASNRKAWLDSYRQGIVQERTFKNVDKERRKGEIVE